MAEKSSAAIRSVSTDIARELLRRVEPQALGQFHLAEKAAFGPPLAAVLLGDETLVAVAEVLRAIADAIDDHGGFVYKTSSQEDATKMMLNAIRSRLEKQRQEELTELLMKTLDQVLREKITNILPVITPPFPITEEQREILRRCILKIPDGNSVSTGFALCEHGHILTPAHVALRYRNLEVVFEYGGKLNQGIGGKAEVIYLDQEHDIAILFVDKGDWQVFRNDAGLRPAPLALGWEPRDPVLCMGYQEQHITDRPRSIGAAIDPWDSILPIKFGKESQFQNCLILTWPPGEGQITFGMSGGPVLNLRKNMVIATVVGSKLPAWQRQDDDVWVQVAPGYGFAIPLSDVAECWPGFEKCCLQGHKL